MCDRLALNGWKQATYDCLIGLPNCWIVSPISVDSNKRYAMNLTARFTTVFAMKLEFDKGRILGFKIQQVTKKHETEAIMSKHRI